MKKPKNHKFSHAAFANWCVRFSIRYEPAPMSVTLSKYDSSFKTADTFRATRRAKIVSFPEAKPPPFTVSASQPPMMADMACVVLEHTEEWFHAKKTREPLLRYASLTDFILARFRIPINNREVTLKKHICFFGQLQQ